jgi:GT2 family glycosyltransferase
MNSFIRPKSGGLSPTALIPSLVGIDVSVVMVVYRTGPALGESLRKVLASSEVDELLVVDNGSAPDEVAVMDAAAAEDARVTILRGQGNVGFARGANLGASAAHGRLLVFLNPDAFLEPGCIPALDAAIDPARSPCLVGARVMNQDGTEQRGARRGEVTPVTTVLSFTHLAKRVSAFRGFEIHHEADPEPEGPTPVPTISGACFAMTRTDFAAVGGFDEGYFLHVEDIDLCWRVRKSGGAVLFQPAARVVHLGSTSLKAPVIVEVHKGFGLARYFRKRADTFRSKLVAYLLFPAIIAVSVLRAGFRNRPRRT